jgi:hypothetical protein
VRQDARASQPAKHAASGTGGGKRRGMVVKMPLLDLASRQEAMHRR